MPSFDVVSEIDQQEIRNAVDQAAREVATRYDFKGTDTTIELRPTEIKLHSLQRGPARRAAAGAGGEAGEAEGVPEGARLPEGGGGSGATARQVVKLVAGISKEKATELNKHIKGLA